MAVRRFIDTNTLLRYLTNDDPDKAQASLALLTRIARRQEEAVTSSLVIFEVVFTLQRGYKVPRERIKALVEPIVSLRGLKLPGKRVYSRAFDLYTTHNVSFADAYNAAYMEQQRITEIYTWDSDFDTLPGITRVEPQ